jgi:4-hydroxybenzoate polyprenyltransferase
VLRHYLELIRFSHTLFALPFALLAAVMAWRQQALDLAARAGGATPAWPLAVRWQELLGILLAMATARSAAMAFNRLADRRLDAANPRTAGRHLPAGLLSVREVTLFAVVAAVAFAASTLLFLPNRLPLRLAAPVLVFLCGYSYAKRFTSLAHFWLGAALGMSPLAAWIAIRGEAVLADPADLLPPLVLGAAVLTWVGGFDVIYACQDAAHDREVGLHSLPARRGVPGALRWAAACHVATVALLAAAPLVFPSWGGVYLGGVAATACLLLYEHALVRPDDLQRVNQAFFHVNAVIGALLLAVGTWDAVW